jgi:hypothetical protein
MCCTNARILPHEIFLQKDFLAHIMLSFIASTAGVRPVPHAFSSVRP